MERITTIANDQIYVKTNKTNVANVNFNELFEDKLPDEAIELGAYVSKLRDEDQDGNAKAAEAVKKAYESLKKVQNISDHTNSFYLMVSDIIVAPKGKEMVVKDKPRTIR